MSKPGFLGSVLMNSSLPSKSKSEVRAAHCAFIAEFGDNTSAGFRTKSDQTYSPRTVFPEPGGATICNRFFPDSSCGMITELAAT